MNPLSYSRNVIFSGFIHFIHSIISVFNVRKTLALFVTTPMTTESGTFTSLQTENKRIHNYYLIVLNKSVPSTDCHDTIIFLQEQSKSNSPIPIKWNLEFLECEDL